VYTQVIILSGRRALHTGARQASDKNKKAEDKKKDFH
jgi:hypothetical protein